MSRKKVLEKRLQRLNAKKEELKARAAASEDIAEVRAIYDQLNELDADIAEVNDEIGAIEEESRSSEPAVEVIPKNARHINPLKNGSFQQGGEERSDDPYATKEYRSAFKAFVQRGVRIPAELIRRDDEPAETVLNLTTTTDDISAIIPTTIMQEFIKKVEGVYGTIYNKVRKLNVKGGVQFPISDLSAEFRWIHETEVSARQKAGEIKQYVQFSSYIGEIRVSQTLLASIVSLPVFESEIVKVMVNAYLKAMDYAILNGSGDAQPLGILNDERVPVGNVITMTAEQMGDWKAWRKRLFAKLPLNKREGEFVFPNATIETYLRTMSDDNNRPVYTEATGLSATGKVEDDKFYGRSVTPVEADLIADFDTASSGDVIGVFWVPNDYAVNTNQQFAMVRYLDHETNEYVNKALTVVDGKLLDTAGCYLIKKA